MRHFHRNWLKTLWIAGHGAGRLDSKLKLRMMVSLAMRLSHKHDTFVVYGDQLYHTSPCILSNTILLWYKVISCITPVRVY